jgi:outer membrane scaffolding protein for murein synthesis (MipA/OmpV family)
MTPPVARLRLIDTAKSSLVRRACKRAPLRAGAAACLLGLAAPCCAGVLDSLRAIDINDYAVGIGVSTTESIYVDAGDSQTIYPYLTKLVPSALDDGVTFGRDGAYGVRWLSSNGFEIGALGKLQTQGYEADDSPMFAGLADRAWTVEVGPTFGWRGSVHVDWTAFVDLLRNHKGSNQLLRLSLPRAFPRGYLIPEVGFHRYTRQFVDYYYGVPLEAAAPGRPAFEGEPANGLSLGLAWGVRMTPHWIFTGALDVERFGAEIADSPLVADDDQSRLTLQVTYDGAPFQAPDAATQVPVNLDFGLAEIKGETADDSSNSLGWFEAALRVARRHRVAVGGFDATYSPSAGAEILIRNLQLLYGYDLLDDRQKTVTVEAGLHVDKLSADDAALQLPGRTANPLPMLAVDAAARFESRLSIRARLQLLMLDGEGYSGRQMFAAFGLYHRTFANLSFGVGYVFNRVALRTANAELAPLIEPLHQGPSLLISASF